ncbi:hypothetical protein M8J76_007179 [Diaphorina citri]|nr:hypothetical protein M8J75_003455 [Diaphorina citri]KAI5723502.1 hypothetical protein M8J76_007179 [Diaphorina citri]
MCLATNQICILSLFQEKQGQGILCPNKMVHILSTLSNEQGKRGQVILCPNKMVNSVHPCLATDIVTSSTMVFVTSKEVLENGHNNVLK